MNYKILRRINSVFTIRIKISEYFLNPQDKKTTNKMYFYVAIAAIFRVKLLQEYRGKNDGYLYLPSSTGHLCWLQ
jgi:hypothetical protein